MEVSGPPRVPPLLWTSPAAERVYGMIDRKEGAKPVPEQLTGIREKFEEYFNPQSQEQQPAKKTPQFSQTPGHSGVNPNSEEDKLYKQLADSWK